MHASPTFHRIELKRKNTDTHRWRIEGVASWGVSAVSFRCLQFRKLSECQLLILWFLLSSFELRIIVPSNSRILHCRRRLLWALAVAYGCWL